MTGWRIYTRSKTQIILVNSECHTISMYDEAKRLPDSRRAWATYNWEYLVDTLHKHLAPDANLQRWLSVETHYTRVLNGSVYDSYTYSGGWFPEHGEEMLGQPAGFFIHEIRTGYPRSFVYLHPVTPSIVELTTHSSLLRWWGFHGAPAKVGDKDMLTGRFPSNPSHSEYKGMVALTQSLIVQ